MTKNSYNNGILVTMPKLFVIIILMVIILPTLGILFGFKLAVPDWSSQSIIIYHALYYWSISIIATLITLLAFTHYQLTKDNVALSLGFAYLFAAYFNTAFTLANEWVSPLSKNVENLHAYVWVLSNICAGILLLVGLSGCLLKKLKQRYLVLILLILTSLFILASNYYCMHWLKEVERLPEIIHSENTVIHPFGLINLCLYLYLIFAIYPRLIKKKLSLLTHSIFYIAIAQIVISCYMIFGSTHIYDTVYLSALLIQLLIYLIPFFALILSYLSSYDFALESQKELRQQKEKFEQLSTYDPLTFLLNRRAFEETTNKMIENAKRYDYKFTLLYLDLDNFKSVNDSIGHDVGDALIKAVAIRLKKSIRMSDYCARLGGDEFGIILTEINSQNEANLVAHKLITILNRPFRIKGKQLYTGASIGIAIYPSDGTTYHDLLKNADTAMYRAKTSGKNTYTFYTKNLSKIYSHELEIATQLRVALKKNEFYLSYQPIYHLLTQKIIGGEVLLRWKNKVLGKIIPQEFISIAEKLGMMIPLGNWVLENACKQIEIWNHKYQKPLQFSINVSPIQLSHSNFIRKIKSTLRKHHINPNLLNLELTETALLENRVGVEKNIIALEKNGLNLALDDFGTGHSSLTRLKNLPISTLKIDKSFVMNIEHESNSAIIIEIIIQLAKKLQKKVIAEGITTESQLKFLIDHGCHYGQGFLFSEPLSANQFESLVYIASSS
ncbi:sensory box protein [Legionella donaldsonii]|uniref:Sensory box protein n=1 Tax=Legionella donaldsonii TaxID=45060 RepID=A0A378J280_9GAMM|nr:EAL domain-containing protein [Legionella donaldsonii]STX41725.1 sensory box protein [Legionella donaldsonii]